MKIKNASRVLSFLLVIAMCIPMIVIPSFASESAVSEEDGEYLYENTFETYKEGHTWTGADNYFEINPNNKLASSASKHTVIKNPEDSSDLVWKFPMESANNQNHLYLATNGFSYTTTPKIIFELDFYVQEDAYGSFFLEFRTAKYTGGSGNPSALAIKMGTSSSTADTVVLEDRQDSGNYKQYTISRGKWYHLSYAWDMANGTYRTSLDDKLIFSGKRYTNVNFTNASFADVNLYSYNTYCGKWGGSLLVDDIRISDNAAKFFPAFENTFESYTVGAGMTDTSSGKGFASDLSSLGYTVATDPKNANNKVLGVPVTDAAADNYKAATKEHTTSSDYTKAEDLTFREDFYIPTGAVGSAKIQGWERYSTDSTVWEDFFYINFTSASSAATIEFPSSAAYTVKGGDLKLNRDTWYTLTVSLKQSTGDMTVLVDGEVIFVGNLGKSINIAQFFIARMKTSSACGVALNGTVYVDNIRIYKGCFKNGEITASRTYKWSNDFEKYTVDTLITDTSSASGFSSQLSSKYGCTVVPDPKNASNRVMNVPTEKGDNYVGQTYDWRGQGDGYRQMKMLVFEQDLYFPSATTGTTRVQGWQKVPTEGFISFYDIDFSIANKDATISPVGKTSYLGNLAVTRDTWHRVTFSLVQATGEYYVLIDGRVAAIGTLSSSSLQICTFFFFRARSGAQGSVYIDNMDIYEGFDKGVMADSAIYRNNFESYSVGHVWSAADSYFNVNPNKPAGFSETGVQKHSVVADPADSANKVWQIPLNTANLNNNQVQTATSSAVNYQKNPEITLAMNVYVPAGSVGDVKMQGFDDSSDTFYDLYHILMLGDSASVWVDDSVAYTGDRTLTLNAWHIVEYSVVLATGEFKLTVDGKQVYSGNNGYNNVSWDFFILAKLQSTQNVSSYTGTLLLDNILITPELAYGEMAKTSYLYENTMEQYWNGHVLGGDAWFNSNINDGNHGHMIVTDPANLANKAWKVPMGAENANNTNSALKIGNNVISYTNTPNVVFEIDMYVPSGATGTFLMEAWSRDRSDAFQYFYTVDITSVGAEITPYGTYSYAGENLELERDTWYKIAFALDMVTGGYTIYVDGSAAAIGITGQTNLLVSNDSFMIAKVETSRAGSGCVLFDNICLYKGETPFSTVVGESVTEDFADIGGVYLPMIDKADRLAHSVYSYAIHDSVVFEAEYYVGAGAEGVIESKLDTYRYLAANIWGIGKELSFYSIDLASGKIYQKENSNVYGTLNVGEWNTVSAVIDLTTGSYSVYVNGIGAFNAKTGHANLTLGVSSEQCWQFAAVTTESIVGDVKIDNVSARLLGENELIIIRVDPTKTLQYIDLTVGGVRVRTGVASLLLPLETAYTANAVYFDEALYERIFTTEKKNSIRLNGVSGLRFATLINDTDLLDRLFAMAGTEIADVYFSTLIAPADYLTLTGNVFTKEALDALSKENGGRTTYLDILGTYGDYIAESKMDNDPSTVHFAASIVNVRKANYQRDFAGIGYLEIQLLTGEIVTVYSSDFHCANIQSVAEKIKNAGDGYYESLNDDCRATIDMFADYVAPAVEQTEEIVPAFVTNGTQTGSYTTAKSEVYTAYSNVTVGEMNTYRQTLTSYGFTLYTSNTMEGNEFATYVKGSASVQLFYYPLQEDCFRILVSDTAYLPDAKAPEYTVIDGLNPTLIQLGRNGVKQGSAGQAQILQLVDGSFVIVDGGPRDAEDAYELLTFLYKHKPAEHAKPRITWFITHIHGDHVELALDFMEAYCEYIELETVAYNAPDFEGSFKATNESNSNAIAYLSTLNRVLKECYPNVKEYTMQTGDCFKLPGCTVDVLQTYLDLYPNTSFAGINETSTVFKVTFDSGKSILITGDIYPVNCNWLVTNYADSLKADIVQTPHHGRDGATAAFYDALLDDMQILLWTNSAAFLEARDGSANDAYDWSHNNAILTNTRIRQYHNSSDLVIDMTDLSTKGEN